MAYRMSKVAQQLIPKEMQNRNLSSAESNAQKGPKNSDETRRRLRSASTSSRRSAQGLDGNCNRVMPHHVCFQLPQDGNSTNLGNVFWVDYEHSGSHIIFMHFDLDGEIYDIQCHKFEFSDCCTVITRLSKVPAILQDVPGVFQSIGQEGMYAEDSYKLLMKNETKKREEKGAALVGVFETRARVILPYPVEPYFFDKEMAQSTSFEISHTEEGSAFVNFWLKRAE